MTEISRRALVRGGAAGVVLAPFAAARAAAAAPSTTGLYTRSRYAPLRGASFKLVNATGSVPVTLTTLFDLPSAEPGDDRRFGLTFHCSTTGPPQGTYTLRRPGFTSTLIFVVPSDADRRTLQVVVNSR